MKVFVASDHHGFAIKERLIKFLEQKNFEVIDAGDRELDPNDDYPVFASRAINQLISNDHQSSKAILLCGSGQGMCMAANRFKGIRAALCMNNKMAITARNDDDANVLCLSADNVSIELAEDISLVFLNTPFANSPRFVRRIEELDKLG